MDDLKIIIKTMADVKAKYEFAKTCGIGVAAAKESMKNVAFNYFDQLQNIAQENISLREEIEMLNVALADSDKELKALREKKKTKESPDR